MLDQLERGSERAAQDGVQRSPDAKGGAARVLHFKSALATLWQWRQSLLFSVALAIGAWLFGPMMLYGPLVPAERVVRTDFLQTIVASGHVLAPYRVSIGSQLTGVVADVPVEEGQSVKAGDVLVQLDDREARAAVAQNEGLVAQSEARVRQMRELTLPAADEALKQAKATLLDAQQAYDRAKALAEKGYGTRVALDDAVKALDVARAQVRSAEFQVYTNRPGGSDYVMVETQLAQARANLVSAQARLTYTVVKAPRDGVLISRNVERGNIVQPSSVLMLLSPTGETQVEVDIDEKNIAFLRVGQKAMVSADAFPDQSFAADIKFINPGIDINRATVEVKLRVANPPNYLRQDMTVSVDIQTALHPAAIVVPASTIRGGATKAPWVIAVKGGRAVRQPVQIGLQSAGWTEVLSGLDEGAVVLPAVSPAQERARVRPLLRSANEATKPS